jgi:ADP-ribose pyrophosphatase
VAENLTVVGQRLEPGEEIEVRTVPVSEAIEMVRDGTLRDAKSIAGLLMWLDARRRNEP